MTRRPPIMSDVAPLDAPPPVATRSRAWLMVALIVVAARALPVLSFPIDRDQGTYCLIGQGLLGGQELYLDLWDNKPPGIFYIFALVVKLFGPVMWCVGVVDILWLLAITYFIFRFAERYLGTAAAVLAAVIHAHWHVRAGDWWAAQPETFLMFFVFASFFLTAREGRWPKLGHLAAGLLFGAAFWLKYSALAFLPFLLLLPYLDTGRLDTEPRGVGLRIPWRDWFLRVAAFAASLTAAVAGVLVYFWLAGSWAALKEVQFDVLPRYGAMAFKRTPHYWLWAINETQSGLGLWTECAALGALLIAWRTRDLARFSPIIFGAGIGYVSAAMQIRFHSYTFETCYPFLAMIWGYLGVKLYEGFRAIARELAARGWRLARVLIWVVFANIAYWPLPEEVASLGGDYTALRAWCQDPDRSYTRYLSSHPLSHFPGVMRVIHYLQQNSASTEGLFVWGTYPSIYFLTGCRPPTRFVSNLALISPWAPPAWRQELMRDLERSRPRFIVVARRDAIFSISYTFWDSEKYLQAFPEFAAFISDYYEPAVDFENFVIYRRREFSQTGTPVSDVLSRK